MLRALFNELLILPVSHVSVISLVPHGNANKLYRAMFKVLVQPMFRLLVQAVHVMHDNFFRSHEPPKCKKNDDPVAGEDSTISSTDFRE